MPWISPDELAQYRKGLGAGDGAAVVEPRETLASAPVIVPEVVDKRLGDKIAASPTAAPIKNALMEAMLRALPPGLQEKVRAYGRQQALPPPNPNPGLAAKGDPMLDSAADPVILEGECRHA